MAVINISNLNFSYNKKAQILRELNINVPEGSIYGFLGKNGAGKSTTIQNILGLLRPQSGSIQVFGQDIRKGRPKVFQNIGALIEAPSLYPQLNAIENLRIACKYFKVKSSSIEPVLKKVMLWKHRRKKAKQYSTGMKQRLGLAIALLHNPQLLILDEPINGLDPTGIIEVRNILKSLQSEGKTIMLSSHLLAEMEKIATHIGIIDNGSMIFEGSLQDLEDRKSINPRVKIITKQTQEALQILQNYDVLEYGEDSIYLNLEHKNELPLLIKKLVSSNIDIYEVTPQKSDLEKLFIDITNV